MPLLAAFLKYERLKANKVKKIRRNRTPVAFDRRKETLSSCHSLQSQKEIINCNKV